MKDLITGVDVYSAQTSKGRDRRLREFASRYSHFAMQRKSDGKRLPFASSKKPQDWFIYAGHASGFMRWEGIKNSLGMTHNDIFLEMSATGLYGFALHDGYLQEEWAHSNTHEFESIVNYLAALKLQVEDAAAAPESQVKLPKLYLSNFDPHMVALLPVELAITEDMHPTHVKLDDKRIRKAAKLRLRTQAEVKTQKNQLSEALVLFGALVLVGAGGYWYWSSFIKKAPAKEVAVHADPYEGLKRTLTSSGVNVKARMVQFYLNMRDLERLNGWAVKEINLHGDSTVFGVERSWGTWDSLSEQVKNKDFLITSLKGKYQLSQRVRTNVVMAEAVGIKTVDTIRYINDSLAYWWPDKMTLREKTQVTNGQWNQVSVEISLRNVYPADLDNMASLLNGWPITFDQMRATLGNGSLSGSLTLQVIGIGQGNKA